MSRFAPVVPLPIARWLQGESKEADLLGGYHLLLAHDVLQYPSEYKEVYGEVRIRYPNAWIILDNSVVELGSAIPIKELVEACRIVEPDCLVIPDVMGDAEGTERLAEEFVKRYREMFPDNKNDALMGVAQGRFASEVRNCMYFLSSLGIKHLGIPRVVTQYLGSRIETTLHALNGYAFDSIHLLGFSDNVLVDVCSCRIPGVAGIDSAVPIRAGLKGMHLSMDSDRDYGKRGDYWSTSSQEISKNPGLVIDNICNFRRWIGESVA